MKLVTTFKLGTATPLQNWSRSAVIQKFIFLALRPSRQNNSFQTTHGSSLFLTEGLCCGFGVVLIIGVSICRATGLQLSPLVVDK